MRNDKIKRFRPRSNKYRPRRNNNLTRNNGTIHQVSSQRNNFSRNGMLKNPHNLERVIEKYKNLAKDAMSSGDVVLHENYLQHCDHFSRILSEMAKEKPKSNNTEENLQKIDKNSIINEQN